MYVYMRVYVRIRDSVCGSELHASNIGTGLSHDAVVIREATTAASRSELC